MASSKNIIGLAYIRHINYVEHTFNCIAGELGLPLKMDASLLRENHLAQPYMMDLFGYAAAFDDIGIICERHLRAVLTYYEGFLYRFQDQRLISHISGPPASGKTKTTLAMQWVGPINYVLTGQVIYLAYLSPGIGAELQDHIFYFDQFYGGIEIAHTGRSGPTDRISLRAFLAEQMKLRLLKTVYLGARLRFLERDTNEGRRLRQKITKTLEKIQETGRWPLVLIDDFIDIDVRTLKTALKRYFRGGTGCWTILLSGDADDMQTAADFRV